ncbi:SNARE associated Golgi protein [Clostridium sp. N3C]|uniref:DedA family protein n=1 Tax=Clostridium sp. N3C TaxID=1776758 RepID=UPI00092E0C8B|nr:VTT domain-containing protein [Clostridium sp. N3C]SCN26009.1 SNARE associated Golgi protein [Clostridium sp. N3C]
MNDIIETVLKNLSQISPWIIYLALFLSAVLQIFFPPYPGDTVLLVGGCLVSLGARAGDLSIFLSYVIGTILSSYVLYLLGYRYGEGVLNFKYVKKYFSQKMQNKVKRLMWKYSIFIFFMCKFIPGIGSITILFGGIFRYKAVPILFMVGLSSLIHNFIFFIIGKSIGYNLERINEFLSTYNVIAIGIFALLAAMASIFLYRKRCKKRSAL